MASATGATGLAIEISIIFQAPRERVFEAWTKPEQLARWMCRTSADVNVRILNWDLRPGGSFAVEAQSPNGPLHHLDCVVREVRSPERFVFAWKWQGEEEETIVAVEFSVHKATGGTEIRLTHSAFATEKSRDGHTWGWNACFDALATILN